MMHPPLPAAEWSASVNAILANAVHLHQAGRLQEAIDRYTVALASGADFAEIHYNIGLAYKQQGCLDAAATSLEECLRRNPRNSDAHNNLGNVRKEQGRLDDAVACYRTAVAQNPNHKQALGNLGGTLRQQGHLQDAGAWLCQAVKAQPDRAELFHELGLALHGLGNYEQAIGCYRFALGIKPDYPEAAYNLGLALQSSDQVDESVACYRQVIQIQPDFADAYKNLGAALRQQGFLDDAIACLQRGVGLQPEDPDLHLNLAMGLLARGDMAAGWQEFEWRWKTPQLAGARRNFSQPQWYGEPGVGRTLLIHAEQGFGDTLQFCRYAALAAARGLNVVMQVQPPLVRLLRSLAGATSIIGYGDAVPDFDVHCPMLSLPLALGTKLETIPSAVPYLHADAAQAEPLRLRLAEISGPGLRVGLVWAGNPRSHAPACAAVDRRRSMAADRLAPLLATPGVLFFSLQKDGPPAPASSHMLHLMHEMTDFADTAALVANLDLVISVDTAVAHLAAALGKPVWLLDRFDPCWRWLTGRRDSPWYPALRLYRQPRAGDWDSIVAEVARDLRELVDATKQGNRVAR